MENADLSSRPEKAGDFPSRPKDWQKTLAELTKELMAGKRAAIGEKEIQWARDFERSLITPAMRRPQPGDVYELLEDLAVDFTMELGGLGATGGRGLLTKGDKVYMGSRPADAGAFSVAVQPFERELENRLISESDPPMQSNGGIYFDLAIVELNQKCRLVQTGYEKKGRDSYGTVVADSGPSVPRSRKSYGPDRG